MKQILFSLFVVSLTTIASAQVQNYNEGDTVGNFTVIDTKGVEHNLYDITASGKYIFIDFFFVTCPPCQQTQKYFNELHEKYGCNQGEVYTLSISDVPGNTNEAIDQYEETYGGPFTHGPAAGIEGNGTEAGDLIGINAYPTYFLVGPDNVLIDKDIWPVSNVGTYESAFPEGFNPAPMECEGMATSDVNQTWVSVYPSVSEGNFNINLTDNGASKISVYDMSGNRVFENSYQQKSISLDLKLAPGVYVLNIQANNKKSSKKIVIK